MKNPETKWSWKQAFQGATGGAANGAVTGAITASFVPDPTGATLAAAIALGATTGFIGSLVADGIGYIWDFYFPPFASAPLYNFVTGLIISVPLIFSAIFFGRVESDLYKLVGSIAFLSNLISSASARLIDDIRAREKKLRDTE